MLQLYRLTNTDIVTLEEKLKELMAEIERLEGILSDQSKLDGEIKTTLRKIKKEYATPRRTVVKDTVTEIKINAEELVSNERVMVVLTIDGYLKRVSLKSYSSSSETTGLKPGDAPLNIFEASTLDKIMIATDMGNYLYLPVYDIPEAKWKEMGKHISNIVTVNPDEKVVSSFIVNSSTQDENIIFVTKDGMVKKTRLGAYNVTRFNKEMVAIKLKDKDSVKAVNFENNDFIIVTENGYSLRFDTADIPASGVKTSGVKGISLKDGDQVISGYSISQGDEYLTIFTDNKTAKRIKLEELEKSSRAKRGTTVLKKVKSTSYKVKDVLLSNSKTTFNLKYSDEVKSIKASEIPIMDLSSTGSSISKTAISSVQVEPVVVSISEGVPVEAKEIEDKNDDFLEDFKL